MCEILLRTLNSKGDEDSKNWKKDRNDENDVKSKDLDECKLEEKGKKDIKKLRKFWII